MPKKVIALYPKMIYVFMVSELEYGGTREILLESAATMR